MSSPVKDMGEQVYGSCKWGDADPVGHVCYNILRFGDGKLGDEDIIIDDQTYRGRGEGRPSPHDPPVLPPSEGCNPHHSPPRGWRPALSAGWLAQYGPRRQRG